MSTEISKVWFASFADTRLSPTLRRIGEQASEFGFVTERSRLWTEKDLDADFVRKMGKRLSPKLRGYGFWCWKPQVWLQMLSQMPEGDLLLYLDAGCYLNAGGKRRFGEYLDMMDATDILAFQNRSFKGTTEPDPRHHLNLERERTKGDCLDHYGVRNNPHVAETGQMVGGVVIMRNTERVRDFARRFREVFFEHFELVDDSPSKSPNEKGFIKHRHDQSIFSIMCKLEGYDRFALSSGEMFPKLRKRTPEEVAALGGRDNWRYASFEEMSECPLQTRREKRLNPLARLLKNVRGAFGIDTQW